MIARKICILEKGLKGTDNPDNCDYIFNTEDELIKHLTEKHNAKVVDTCFICGTEKNIVEIINGNPICKDCNEGNRK